MNNRRRIPSLLFSLFLLLGAAPVWAVSFNSSFSVARFNTAGSAFVNMTPRNTTFCYLSSISFEDTDTGGEEATCRLTRGAVVWTLEAILDASSDADSECTAICYNN
jgi:hypothetical protein